MTACAALMLAGCGAGDTSSRGGREAGPPLTLDWRSGTFEGIRLGSSTAHVVAKLGRPRRHGPDEPATPIGEDYYEIGGPTALGTPGRRPRHETMLRFERRAFFAVAGRIYGWVTTSERAATPEGVGVGDARSLVEERYPDAHCYTANEGSEYATFPLCEVQVCRGRVLAMGGNPIKSLWLVAETTRGRNGCARPTPTT